MLQEILRETVQDLVVQAVEQEVADWISRCANMTDSDGRRLVVRNGRLPMRKIVTGAGLIEIQQPRVLDRRRPGETEEFTSKILPSYLRNTHSDGALVLRSYLHAIRSGDFEATLKATLGHGLVGLPRSTMIQLKAAWKHDYGEWLQRPLSEDRYVHVWADAVQFEHPSLAGLECHLVLMGARNCEERELFATHTGQRTSRASWRELLRDVQARGLTIDPDLASGDADLGFWKAL